jgi:plastocyanin
MVAFWSKYQPFNLWVLQHIKETTIISSKSIIVILLIYIGEWVMKRYLLILMLLLIISSSSIAAKDNDQGKGNGKDKEQSDSPENGVSGNSNDQGKGNEKDKESDSSGNGGSAYTINIKDDSFKPSILLVPQGTIVTWHNQDGKVHVLSSNGQFNSVVINPGKKFSFYFGTFGDYTYSLMNTAISGTIKVAATTETSSSDSKVSIAAYTSQPLIEGSTSQSSTKTSSSQVQTQATMQQGTSSQVGQKISPNSILQYSQYYSMSSSVAASTHIIAPQKYSIQVTPSKLYFGYQMQEVPYSQYQTYATYTGGNSLWIRGATSWTQYAVVPQGSSLSLLATTSPGGNGYLYEINPNGILSKNSFNFFPGNSQIGFNAGEIGQHILLFVIGGQVSNSIVIDVTSYSPSYQQPVPAYPPTQTLPPVTTPSTTYGDTPVTIVSQGMRGYQVFLDGTIIGTEGTIGDALDGRFSFNVVGNQNHDIRVYDGQFNYPKTMFFQRGVLKIINVEPGTAVYV